MHLIGIKEPKTVVSMSWANIWINSALIACLWLLAALICLKGRRVLAKIRAKIGPKTLKARFRHWQKNILWPRRSRTLVALFLHWIVVLPFGRFCRHFHNAWPQEMTLMSKTPPSTFLFYELLIQSNLSSYWVPTQGPS